MLAWILAVFIFSPSLPAEASLGRSTSVSQALKLKVAHHKLAPLYSVQTYQNDSYVLNEWIDQNGTVFAITWSGMRHPDLNDELGPYKDLYQFLDQNTDRPKGIKTRALKSEGILSETGGTPRNLVGRVIATRLIPTGVKISDIK